jgi:hypothetical protein
MVKPKRFMPDYVLSEMIEKVFIILTLPIKEQGSFLLLVIILPIGLARYSNIRNILEENMVLCLYLLR